MQVVHSIMDKHDAILKPGIRIAFARGMKVRLTKRLAAEIDGIDLHDHQPGDLLNLSDREASLLVAEQWAIPERREQSGEPPGPERRATHSSGCTPSDQTSSDDETAA